MTGLLVGFPGGEAFAEALATEADCDLAQVDWHRFPDGESNVRFETPVKGKSIAIVCSLDRPDEKFLRLIFCAATARDLGAARIGLVAPYLAYMRQDRRFREGEGITARYFPKALGAWFDWLVTADPHLHRIHHLSEVYPIRTRVVHCTAPMGHWIRDRVERPLVVGPDAESAQWAEAIAEAADAPYVVLQKARHGDRSVEIAFPDLTQWSGRQPVLIDDIVSTGRSMIEAVRGLESAGFSAPWCVAVHGVFAGDAYRDLIEAGVAGISTCNTISHPSNGIDVTGLFVDPLRELI
jgi:ribose-phosphate pyrophosphokinase